MHIFVVSSLATTGDMTATNRKLLDCLLLSFPLSMFRPKMKLYRKRVPMKMPNGAIFGVSICTDQVFE